MKMDARCLVNPKMKEIKLEATRTHQSHCLRCSKSEEPALARNKNAPTEKSHERRKKTAQGFRGSKNYPQRCSCYTGPRGVTRATGETLTTINEDLQHVP